MTGLNGPFASLAAVRDKVIPRPCVATIRLILPAAASMRAACPEQVRVREGTKRLVKTVWFNKGHSVRNALVAIRMADRGRIRLIASHPFADAAALTAADIALVEPWIAADDVAGRYRDWCLDVCRTHAVDLFIAGDQRETLAPFAAHFAAIGTRLALAGTPQMLETIDDKYAFTLAAADHGLPVAQTHRVTEATGFADAVTALQATGHGICVKPARGVFGAGFWRLDDSQTLFDRLMTGGGHTLPVAVFAAALAEPVPTPLLVMEYLPGDETSVDILADHGRVLLAVARRKQRVAQHLSVTGPAIDLATRTVAAFGLHGLVNVQMIADRDDRQTLLEVNPRMSGGCHYALFAGANLPWWHVALELELAAVADLPVPVGGAVVAAIPDAVRIDGTGHPTFAGLAEAAAAID